MVIVDKERCTGCGLCEKICHEHCIGISDHVPIIHQSTCSTCTQCIAVCPRQALTWDGQPPSACNKTNLPSPDQLDELFRERRSARYFTKDRIERELLGKIVSYGIYAPTENFHLRAIIVDEENILAEIEQTLMILTVRIHRLIQPGFISILARLIGLSHTYQRSKAKIEFVMQRGSPFLSPPTALVLVIGEKRIPLSGSSAQYALCNMFYYAQSLGIGSWICGNGPLYLDKNKAIRKHLKIQKRENILGAVFLGYPAIRFTNKVSGRAMPVQWNGSEC
jgi:NAD-dependent dihydropyrimidine dehydrogenase PreA subunit/nitroreductase